MRSLFKKSLFFVLVVGAIFYFDSATKDWAYSSLSHMPTAVYPYGGTGVVQNLWGGIDIALVYRINPGIAWSLFSEYPQILFYVRIGIFILVALFYFLSARRFFDCLALLMILGGALGNIVDFVRFGAVVDMIKVVLWGWHYPVFNVADMCVVGGVILFILTPKKSS